MTSSRLKAVLLILAVVFALVLLSGAIVQAEFGTNWTAQFYNCTDFSCTIAATASYPNGINEDWGSGKPTDGANVELTAVNADNFSARFVSSQTFTEGTYQFVAASDDGVRVFIDGVLVIDKFITRPLTTDSVNRTMTAGPHTITVEYVEFAGGAVLQFQWFYLGATTPTVTGPTVTPVPVTTGSVVYVTGLSLRTGPYLGASRIGVLKPDTAYPVSGRNTDEGSYTWYLVTAGDQTGWASGRYLQITGDPNSVPLLSTIFDQIDNAPYVGAVAIPRAYMNLRRRPSIRTAKIGTVPWGEEAELIGRTIQGGQLHWLQVRYNGQVGWIFAPYVTVKGTVDAVPVR
jgi:uncharacterized protein YraI